MRIRLHLVALALVLTGCAATTPVLPDVQPSAVTTAQVVVTQPCVTDVPPPPAWAVDALPKSADEFQRARALIAEHLQARDYAARLQAILAACKGP